MRIMRVCVGLFSVGFLLICFFPPAKPHTFGVSRLKELGASLTHERLLPANRKPEWWGKFFLVDRNWDTHTHTPREGGRWWTRKSS